MQEQSSSNFPWKPVIVVGVVGVGVLIAWRKLAPLWGILSDALGLVKDAAGTAVDVAKGDFDVAGKIINPGWWTGKGNIHVADPKALYTDDFASRFLPFSAKGRAVMGGTKPAPSELELHRFGAFIDTLAIDAAGEGGRYPSDIGAAFWASYSSRAAASSTAAMSLGLRTATSAELNAIVAGIRLNDRGGGSLSEQVARAMLFSIIHAAPGYRVVSIPNPQ